MFLDVRQKLEVLEKATIEGRTSTYKLKLDRPLVTKGYRDHGKDYVAVADSEPGVVHSGLPSIPLNVFSCNVPNRIVRSVGVAACCS